MNPEIFLWLPAVFGFLAILVAANVLYRLVKNAKNPTQTTWCYCPQCKKDLCSNDSFISDDDNGVLYQCTNCGCESLWDFDAAPVPLLVKCNSSAKQQQENP